MKVGEDVAVRTMPVRCIRQLDVLASHRSHHLREMMPGLCLAAGTMAILLLGAEHGKELSQ